jgi:hypothetical protein
MKCPVLSCGLRSVLGALLPLWLLVLGSGCARRTAVVEFPTLQALRRIAAQPASPPNVAAGAIPASGWTVESRYAAQSPQDLWQPSDDWGRAFLGSLPPTPKPPRLTRALACVAREVGRFQLETQNEIPSSLKTFVLGACGAVVPSIGSRWVSGTVTADLPDEKLLAQWRDQLKTQLVAQLPADASEVGFWFGRKGDQALASVVYSRDAHEIKPLSLLPGPGGTVTIEGSVRDQVDHFEGFINQGRFGVESCLVDPGVAPPQFRIVCPVAPGDRTAWVQLMYAQPKRVLMTLFLQGMVRRTADEALAYTEPTSRGPSESGDKIGFVPAALAELNAVRSQAKLQPVRLAEAQSATAAKVAGHYFMAAQSSHLASQMEQIALGLLAGWEVAGMIRGGSFFADLSPSSRDPAHWLHSALALPAGRSTLLAPEIEQIAVGPVVLPSDAGMGAVITGYRLHHGSEHGGDVARLLSRLSFARQSAGLGAASPLSGVQAVLDHEVGRVHSGERQPGEALSDVLQQVAEKHGQDVGGYVIETTSLDGLQIPPEILKRPQLQVAIGVTHHKPAGAAWAQYAIFVVYLRSDPPGV